jgi:hypothetical protein
MSVSEIGKRILCDGEGCQAVASPPIALRAQLHSPDPELPTAEGWLFITGRGSSRHFCPRCALHSLDSDVFSNFSSHLPGQQDTS